MRHAELKELLPLYIDGGLDRDEAEMVEAHLAECAECREELAMYEQNFDFLSMADEVEVSEDFLPSLMRRVEEEKEAMQREEVTRPRVERKASWWERLRELVSYRMRVPVGVAGAVAAVFLLMLLVGPLADLQYQQDSRLNEYQYGVEQPEVLYDRQMKTPGPSQAKRNVPTPQAEQFQMDLQMTQEAADEGGALGQIERKLIQRANLTIEVKDLQETNDRVLELVQEVEGYIASSSDWVSGNRQNSRMQIKVPAEQFYAIMDELEDLGVVTHRNISAQDVTEEYIDLDSRAKNLVLQEDRYRQLLQKATKVEDIISIERELERVRSTLESLQGRLQYLDNQVSMSTIDLNLSEPEPITPNEWGIIRAFRQVLREMARSFYTMLIRFGALLPYLILLLIVFTILRFWWKRR